MAISFAGKGNKKSQNPKRIQKARPYRTGDTRRSLLKQRKIYQWQGPVAGLVRRLLFHQNSRSKTRFSNGAPVSLSSAYGGGGEDDTASLRSRLPSIGSLNLLSDSWDFHIDRFLPFLTENTDFTVVGVIGPPGVGKSTIMNELYGFDATLLCTGMLPPYTIQSEDVTAMARHCSMGIEPRVSAERIILLDTQLGVLLTSICHTLLVVSDGVHDHNVWRLMSTVDLLKHGIPDPSLLTPALLRALLQGLTKKLKIKIRFVKMETTWLLQFLCIQSIVQDQDLTERNYTQLKKTIKHYFSSTSFMRKTPGNIAKDESISTSALSIRNGDPDSMIPKLFIIPVKYKDDSRSNQYESHNNVLWKLRDQVLSMSHPSFSKTLSERDWLKNSAKIWELVKNSTIIADYSKTLQTSGLFRR
ncbi:hypothetical protein G4B88_029012 [Cannabis sativa]|uniref:Uncharacterized protein n=1 Tax=Cannabis sativa TaxID=3483 RepID=A0A7J6HPP5_CANSA|nr:hypothetical protein G4B88_029012 [Cannabis sativa]